MMHVFQFEVGRSDVEMLYVILVHLGVHVATRYRVPLLQLRTGPHKEYVTVASLLFKKKMHAQCTRYNKINIIKLVM